MARFVLDELRCRNGTQRAIRPRTPYPMWIEVILSRDDLARLVAQALPLEIRIGAPDVDHALTLKNLVSVTLVANVGLRVDCGARIHWPVLGVDLPIEIPTLSFVLIPSIETVEGGERLVFRASVEHAEFAALPSMIDEKIREAINSRLAAAGSELSWGFTKALSYVVSLPATLDPLESFTIRPAWGRLRVTPEAMVVAASFHSGFARRGESVVLDEAPPPPRRPDLPRSLSPPDRFLSRSLKAGALVLGLSAAYLVVRRATRPRWLT